MGQRRGGWQRAAFRRAGQAPTTGGAGINSLISSDGRVTIGSASGPIADLMVPLIQAGWTQTITRVYALDPVNGDDTHTGYADPATTSAADYAIACAAAGAAAKKTTAGIRGILPSAGASRQFELVVANGGINTLASIAGDLNAAIGGITGYAAWTARTTGTSTTANCTAFDGSAADCTYIGGITATGMNAAGYNPTGASTTTVITCLQVGGAAPGFAAEAATTMPLGARVRFDNTTGTTTNAALRNVVRQVAKVAGGNSMTFAVAWPVAPAATDTFYLEMPGVNFATIGLANDVFVNNINTLGGFVVGFSTTSTFNIAGGVYSVGFCWAGTSFGINDTRLTMQLGYTHPVRGAQTVGGCRSATTTSITNCSSTVTGLLCGTSYSCTNPVAHTATGSFVVGTSLTFSNAFLSNTGPNIGGTAAVVGTTPRILNGALTLNGPVQIAVGQIDIQNPAGNACVLPQGTNSFVDFSIAGANTSLTGSAGAGFGLNLNNGVPQGVHNYFRLDSAHLPAFTGLGQIILPASIVTTWASVSAKGGLVDYQGNRFFTPNSATQMLKFSGTLFGGAGAVLTYLADAGDALAVNNTIPMANQAAACAPISILVKPRVNTMTQTCSATLYINGAPTTLTVNIGAGSTAVAAASVIGNQFQDGSSFDLRLDAASADAAHTLAVSVVVACSL